MRNILLVGAGGALGSIARYLLAQLFASAAICGEWATLAVNVVGSFLIGLFVPTLGGAGYLFMAMGFCGGFTTFSTFSSQALHLFQAGERAAAALYVVASVVLSLLSAFLGICLADKFIK